MDNTNNSGMDLFNESERELIEAAKMILSDGVRRLSSREGLFPTTQTRTRADRAAIINAREALTDHLVALYGPLRHEMAVCCLIDAQGRLITIEEFPEGKATRCEISARLLAGMCIRSGATACILAHNHPSGDNTPSRQDVAMTQHLNTWLIGMGVELVEHLVLSTDGASQIIGRDF